MFADIAQKHLEIVITANWWPSFTLQTRSWM